MSFRRHISRSLFPAFPAAGYLPVFFVKNNNNNAIRKRKEKQPPTPALFSFFFGWGGGFVVWLIFHLILAALIVFGYHDELETVPGVDVAAAAAFDVVHTSPESLVSGPRALNSI